MSRRATKNLLRLAVRDGEKVGTTLLHVVHLGAAVAHDLNRPKNFRDEYEARVTLVIRQACSDEIGSRDNLSPTAQAMFDELQAWARAQAHDPQRQ